MKEIGILNLLKFWKAFCFHFVNTKLRILTEIMPPWIYNKSCQDCESDQSKTFEANKKKWIKEQGAGSKKLDLCTIVGHTTKQN